MELNETKFQVPVMSQDQKTKSITISKTSFGKTKEGAEVSLYEMSNDNGMLVGIIDYGGAITRIEVPDRQGNFSDVVLGHSNMHGYEEENDFFGCIAGRYANRICNGKFRLDGTPYQLPKNENGNSLHGGLKGFDKQVWEAVVNEKEGELELYYTSRDGEEGYPGELTCKVSYSITNKNELVISYEASSDKKTIINLTNHSYINLENGGVSSILNHELKIEAIFYTPVTEGLIPTGEVLRVKDTPLDFTEFQPVGERIAYPDDQLKLGLGYDHNYIINKPLGELGLAATVIERKSGRKLQVFTTEPGIQFYSGNFLDGSITGKNNVTYKNRNGLCLETQHFPDSPNHPHFPTVILEPGKLFESTTIFRFALIDDE